MGLGGGGESAHHLHPPRFTPESRHSLSCVCCNCQPSSCLIGTTIEHTIATTGLLIVVTYLSRQRWQWTHFQCLSRQGVSTIYVFCTDWQDAIRTVKLVVCATKQRKEIITAVLNGSILQPAIKCKLWCFFFLSEQGKCKVFNCRNLRQQVCVFILNAYAVSRNTMSLIWSVWNLRKDSVFTPNRGGGREGSCENKWNNKCINANIKYTKIYIYI